MSDRSPACPWCDRRVESEAVAVGPPPHLSEHHRFRFHERCLAEWRRFADRLFDLSRLGAGPTLIEYPKNHGPEALLAAARGGDGRAGDPADAPDRVPSGGGRRER